MNIGQFAHFSALGSKDGVPVAGVVTEWSSSDESVLAPAYQDGLNAAKFEAVGAGEATVTATIATVSGTSAPETVEAVVIDTVTVTRTAITDS